MEMLLAEACYHGFTAEVQELLATHPGFDINLPVAHKDKTALHVASRAGRSAVVKLLLAHPAINVNVLSSEGDTPFALSCKYRKLPIVQLLLKDPRVDVTLADYLECSPFWWSAICGCEVMEWLIASGRGLGDLNKKGKFLSFEDTALEIARRLGFKVTLLERFMANPTQTRHEVRMKLGVLDELAAEVFALMVFLCEGLLQLRPAISTAATSNPEGLGAIRFFTIAKRLPMELQMVLCHYVIGSTRQNILSKDSEAAFKSLAGILLCLDPSASH